MAREIIATMDKMYSIHFSKITRSKNDAMVRDMHMTGHDVCKHAQSAMCTQVANIITQFYNSIPKERSI